METHPPKIRKTAAPTFWPTYCGQTAGWIKMPLGTDVGLGPGHIVLDGDPAPPKKGYSPQFSAHVCCGPTAGLIKMLLWSNGYIDQDVTGYGGRPRPRPTLCWMGTDPPPKKKGGTAPIFGQCLLWPNGRPSQLLLSTCCFNLSLYVCHHHF